MNNNEKTFLLNKLLKLCSQKEICINDAYEKMQDSDLKHDEKDEIIKILCQKGFIDEKRYAKAFVHDKIFINKWGKVKIKYYLKLKKINEQLISNALSEIEKEEYIKIFLSVAKTKLKSIKENNEIKRKQKLIQYLMQKGVEFEIADEIWKRLIKP